MNPIRPRVDPDTLGFLITDVARLMKADLDRRITAAGIGITPGEARALMHAARAGPVRQNVLAERMGVEPMTLSSCLDRLQEKGMVERPADPSDGRAKLVRLTAKADGAIDAIRRMGAEVRRDVKKGISDAHWSLLHNLLKTLRANLQDSGRAASNKHEAGT